MNKNIFAFGKAYTRECFRNKLELFFTVLFPVIFLILFGFMFSEGSGSSQRTIAVYANDENVIKTLQKVENWNLHVLDSEEELTQGIRDGKFSFAIHTQDDEIRVLYRDDLSLMGELKTIESTVKAILEKERNQLRSFLQIDTLEIPRSKEQLSDFDYMLTGVLSLSLLSNGMFSMITVFGRYRKTGVLRRVFLTGASKIQLILGVTVVRMILSFGSLFFILLLSQVIFRSNLSFNWFLLVPSIVFITLGMMAVGLFLIVLFKNPNAASNAASLLNTVMVFFAGVYFPLSFLPRGLRWISNVLPVKYAAEVIRYTAGIQDMNFTYFIVVNSIFAASGLMMLWLSAKLFMRVE